MRTRIFALILIFCLVFLVSGLAYVQIFRHERYKVMSEENRLKVIPLTAPRGNIFDRGGAPMVKDVLSFKVSVIYSRIDDIEALTDLFASVLMMEKDEVSKRLKESKKRRFSPYAIAADIGIDKAIYFEEIEADHPGLLIEVSSKREYLYHETASALFGYLGLINRPEFKRLKHYGYSMHDLVGRSGVEKYYDNYLRGKQGGKQVEVDHRGREVRTLGFKEPNPGRDIKLTIDLELQKFCDKLLEGKKGAIVALDPSDGAVIAMATAPAFDPGIFLDTRRVEDVKKILVDKEYPLINRAISGAYPPGSVFKVIVAAGALAAGVVTKDTVFECPGSLNLGRARFRCWRKSGHGPQTIRDALKNSCNVFFYKLGLRFGREGIAEFAEMLGFGVKTGIDLPGESAGTLPTREWIKKNNNIRWYKGDTVNFSIGQGYLLCTPVQVARMMSVFANRGTLVRPYLVSRVGEVKIDAVEKYFLDIPDDSMEIVREGLRMVVNGKRGTGVKARLKNIVVAGKTGTSQTSKGKTHGWFAGFAPFNNAKLTVVVFDEYGGKGGYYAAATAGKVFRKADELGLLN